MSQTQKDASREWGRARSRHLQGGTHPAGQLQQL